MNANKIIDAMRKLASQLRDAANENEGSEAELAFEASASSIERVCNELMEDDRERILKRQRLAACMTREEIEARIVFVQNRLATVTHVDDIASFNRELERLIVMDADEEEIETAYLPRCKECGYTAEDEAIHMDHHLCRGKIPST